MTDPPPHTNHLTHTADLSPDRGQKGVAMRALWILGLAGVLGACDDGGADAPGDPQPTAEPAPMVCAEPEPAESEVLRPRARPIEYVGLSVTRAVDRAGFDALIEPLFGAAARDGRGHVDYALQPGVLLSVSQDERTAEQLAIQLDLVAPGDDGDRRPVARVPASTTYGELFIEAARAALSQVEQAGYDSPFWLAWRTLSPNGGRLEVRLDVDAGGARVTFSTQTPQTSLLDGRINTPAFEGEPYETIGGTVWFELTRDQFDFFVERAYGITDSAGQNFKDFHLRPHDWLRLTVTPELEQERVDVAFEVVTEDGRRLPFARSPASYVAGDLFKQAVLRMVDNMLDAEERAPGSSTPWTVPFHYDDPDGGGVVRVVAQGQGGVFRIAYAVDSPVNRLRPMQFLPYTQPFEIPAEFPGSDSDCASLGSEPAAQGYFDVTFDASSTVRNSRALDGELKGNVWGSVFRAEDVSGLGPREGAQAVASFAFEDVDLTDPDALQTYRIDAQLTAETYQILGFIDIDGNADPDAPDPDVGDPVTVPIGAYPLECATQPVKVEFAILRP